MVSSVDSGEMVFPEVPDLVGVSNVVLSVSGFAEMSCLKYSYRTCSKVHGTLGHPFFAQWLHLKFQHHRFTAAAHREHFPFS